MSTPSHAPLSGRNLACRRGNRRLFAGVDITLERGSVTWLRGANGSGKTSLMRILAGLAKPESGRVERHAELVYVAHSNALKDDLTLTEAVTFMARLHDVPDARARAERALDTLGLQSRRSAFVRTLSQGQRRRGALARLALDDRPRTWILDEPYDALDRDGVTCLTSLIEAHAARGGAVLLTSHQVVSIAGAREFELASGRTT